MTITNNKIKVAKKDIVCYKSVLKIGEKTLRSSVIGFTYILGRLYKRPFTKTIKDKVKYRDHLSGGGFHSYRYKTSASNSYEVVRCIIPKGSKYVLGVQGFAYQYFSEAIIIKEFLTK